ncbi:MAG: peptide ABC transporter [Chloroflexi bacterium RBG_19FT_COMBO_47_9]|nr:MAG: peptide ABC transporter [Chloroflexi bacterium RBG_16_47_49]OGO59984.1 MAG: peptide ABC transporter [Chloroflexi bacterium RBG_19FT_COMBO_47_9]
MIKYAIKRILQVIPVLILVSFIVFTLVRLIPGDPVRTLLGEDVPIEVIQATRERLGLDQPVFKQYIIWVKNIFNGDFGTSFSYKQPVLTLIAERYPATIILATGAIIVSIIFGILFGIIAALCHNTPIDYIFTTVAMLAISTPGFFFAMLMVLLFAITLKLLPSVGLKTPTHYILPILTLGFQQIGMMTRMTRTTMLDVLNQDYIRTAKASGVPPSVMLLSNALKNTLIPLTTIVALRFGGLLAGAVLIEKVFSIHGMGMLLVEAVSYRDYPVIQATILLFSLIFILVTLVADLCYGLVDPRISVK